MSLAVILVMSFLEDYCPFPVRLDPFILINLEHLVHLLIAFESGSFTPFIKAFSYHTSMKILNKDLHVQYVHAV
jgi:hypothetical protein